MHFSHFFILYIHEIYVLLLPLKSAPHSSPKKKKKNLL